MRVREPSDLPCTGGTAHTNFCDITFTGGETASP